MNLVNYFLSAFLSAFAWISGPLHLSSQTAPVPPVAESPPPVLGESDTLGNVLASHTEGPVFFNVNIPSIFNDVVTFKKDIIAPNLVSSLLEGSGIDISSGASPKITNTGVLSLQGSTGALSLVAGDGISLDGLKITNTGIKSLVAGTGISIDGNKITNTYSFTPDYTQSGWTTSTGKVYLTTSTDKVGIGTSSPSTPLHVVGASTLAGAVTLGSSTSDALTFTGRMANGTSLLPDTDLGSDLGSSAKRFNNLWVANINSNSSQSFSGQTTFSYAPTDSTISQASVLINPTTSAANGQLLAFGIAGYQRALIDADGDLIIGYNNLTSAPATAYPLTIYGHSGTNVGFVDTSGNSYFAGNMGIGTTAPGNTLPNSFTSNAASKIFEIASTTYGYDSGIAIRNTTSTVGLDLWTDGNTGISYIDNRYNDNVGSIYIRTKTAGTPINALTILGSGNVGIGTTNPTSPLQVNSTSGTNGININYGNGTGVQYTYNGIRPSSGNTLTISTLGNSDDIRVNLLSTGTGAFKVIDSGNTELFRVGVNGNVGIGTTSPISKLQINGNVEIGDGSATNMRLTFWGGWNGTGFQAFEGVNTIYNGTTWTGNSGYGSWVKDTFSTTTGNPGTDYIHWNYKTSGNLGNSGTTLLTLLGNGNVGIGTTNPGQKLNIVSANNGNALRIEVPATDSTQYDFYLGNAAASAYIQANPIVISMKRNGGPSIIQTVGSNPNNLQLISAANSHIVLTPGTNGNVGIGTTAPGYNLEISGIGNKSSILFNTTVGNPSYVYNQATTTESTTSYAISEFGGTGSYPITVGVKTALGYFIRKNTDYYLNIINGGNVGIGTTAPTSKLHLTGAVTGKALAIFDETGNQALLTASASGVTKFVIDNGGNINIQTLTSGNFIDSIVDNTTRTIRMGENSTQDYLKLGWQAANYGEITTGLSTRHLALQTGGGNVGIGTTNPTDALHVTGNIRVDTQIRDNLGNGIVLQSASGVGSNRILTIGNSTYGTITFPNGNVGIGTTAPVYSLNIYKDADSSLMLHNLTTGITQSDGTLLQQSGSDTYLWNYEPTGKMYFGTNASSKVTIDSSGNVGIGTTSPSYKIEVNGQFRMVANESTVNLGEIIAGTEGIAIKGSYSSQLYLGYPTASGGAGGGRFALYTTNDMFFGGNNVDANLTAGKDWIFKTGGYRQGNEGTEKLRITSAGLVGIGTTAPTSKLHVTGAVVGKALGIFDETGDQALLTASASGVTKLTVNHNGLVDATAGGLATYVKAGTISDTDFADTAVDGLLGVDSTNDRLYVRNSSGVWNYIAFTGGFQIPDYESQDLRPGDLLLPFVESILSDGAAHGMYRKFSLKNLIENEEGLTFRGDTSFRGPIFFYKLAEFIDHVIFRNAPTFPSNMGGIAIIPQNSSSVDIIFSKSFANKPVVTTSLISDIATANQSYPDTVITNISETGFTISLSQLSPSEIKFNWIALAIDNPGTIMGKSTPTESPTPTGSPTPTTTPDPTTTPTSTPSPSPTPDVTPVATVSAEPTPNSPESTESAQL